MPVRYCGIFPPITPFYTDDPQSQTTRPTTEYAKFIELVSPVTGRTEPVSVKYDSNTKGNWMTRGIANRLKLRWQYDDRVRVACFEGKVLRSIERFVSLDCSRHKGSAPRTHTFYLCEHLSFDVLFGSD